jgi:hypothetical protein
VCWAHPAVILWVPGVISTGVKLATPPHLVLRLGTHLRPHDVHRDSCTSNCAFRVSALCRVCGRFVCLWMDTVYIWRCIFTAWEQDYGRYMVQLTVVNQPIHSAFQLAVVSPDKLQAEEATPLPGYHHRTLGCWDCTAWNGES